MKVNGLYRYLDDSDGKSTSSNRSPFFFFFEGNFLDSWDSFCSALAICTQLHRSLLKGIPNTFIIIMDEEVEYQTAEIPEEFKALRACLRCSLIKTFEQVCTLKFRLHFWNIFSHTHETITVYRLGV